MIKPLFSVIIPAYKQAQFLGEAIQSVLNQSLPDFELIIVNDASPDQTAEVVRSFGDQRIKYIIHPVNKGLPSARNTGIQAANGHLIALLDADDVFHPDKLQIHAAYLEEHSDVTVTYNNRFELNHSVNTIRDLYRPPQTLTLRDFVQGFPFAPSDMVINIGRTQKAVLFNENLTSGGEDLDYPLRLALQGSRFANVDKALNYRRYHDERKKKNLRGRLADYTYALGNFFSDPRCPETVSALRQSAFRVFYLEVAYTAFYQDEADIGVEVLTRLCDIESPRTEAQQKTDVLQNFLHRTLANENDEHDQVLQKIFAQFPATMAPTQEEIKRAAAYGYLVKATRAILWGRAENANTHFRAAEKLGASINKKYIRYVTQKLLDYENEFGYQASTHILGELARYIRKMNDFAAIQQIQASFEFNRAIQKYREECYDQALFGMIKSAASNPRYLMNPGCISISLKSMSKILRKKVHRLPGRSIELKRYNS